MKKIRSQKAITLVALIITIIVLLILVVVAIRELTGEGIIAHAKNARDNYNDAQIVEGGIIKDYLTKIEENQLDSAQSITVNQLNKVLSTTVNTKLKDRFGNLIIVPPGFKIVVDNEADNSKNTGYTVETIDVTKGIVIQDETIGNEGTPTVTNGSQFVWIPVGKIYTDEERTESNAKTIILGRYKKFSPDENGNYIPAQPVEGDEGKNVKSEVSINNCKELQPTNTLFTNKARNINDFYDSGIKNGGYYLGRYEASDVSEGIKVQAGLSAIWSGQDKAFEKCQGMYMDNFSNGTFSSDLVNSYAWDTAVIFIQMFGETEGARSYAYKSSEAKPRHKAGEGNDVECNIHDLSGNYRELTTEYGGYEAGWHKPAYRGSWYDVNKKIVYFSTQYRAKFENNGDGGSTSCRPVLYLAISED